MSLQEICNSINLTISVITRHVLGTLSCTGAPEGSTDVLSSKTTSVLQYTYNVIVSSLDIPFGTQSKAGKVEEHKLHMQATTFECYNAITNSTIRKKYTAHRI